jgi:hypothetical protein
MILARNLIIHVANHDYSYAYVACLLYDIYLIEGAL